MSRVPSISTTKTHILPVWHQKVLAWPLMQQVCYNIDMESLLQTKSSPSGNLPNPAPSMRIEITKQMTLKILTVQWAKSSPRCLNLSLSQRYKSILMKKTKSWNQSENRSKNKTRTPLWGRSFSAYIRMRQSLRYLTSPLATYQLNIRRASRPWGLTLSQKWVMLECK